MKAAFADPPGQHQPPAGVTRVTWLGDCVEASDKALEDYRAGILTSDDADGAEVAA